MRTIVIIASYPDSLINFRLHLIKEFLLQGFNVVAMAPFDAKVMGQLTSIGVQYCPIALERNGNNPVKDGLLLIKLYKELKRIKPDFIFSYTIKPVIYGTLAAKLAGVKNIYAMLTGTGYAFSNTNLKSKIVGYIARSLFKFSLRFNNKLFFQNKDNVHEFIANKLISTEQSVVIINGSGVDIKHFNVVPFPHAISFLMIARFLVDKGVREYAAAAKLIKKKHPHIQFKLVGWIDTNPSAISQTELDEWTKEGIVENLGKLSDVRQPIAEASIYVLPSYGEGTPRTVLEAMAMGRPIITTDVPGCRETVIDKLNGFLVPVRDAATLAQAMEHFIVYPDDVQKMGQESRTIAEVKYDVDKVNASILHGMEIQSRMDLTENLEIL